MKNGPVWLQTAIEYIGTKEVPGLNNNPLILKWWKEIKLGGIKDDETSWCAAFVGGVLEECGIKSSRNAAARSYRAWGARLKGPAVGAIVTFWRVSLAGWQGHVGFVIGKDKAGNLMVLGGNQGNEVGIKPFAITRVLVYSWPASVEIPKEIGMEYLPVLASNGSVSTDES